MHDPLATGAQTYGGRLADAGGRELQALAAHSDALAVAMYASPPYDVSVPPLGVARLSINLSQASVSGGLEGERPRSFLARRHSLFLTPAGAGAAWRKASSSRHINIYFHAQSFEHAGASVPLLNAGLPGGGVLFDMLAAELAQPQPFSAEAIDSLARLILVRVARQQARKAQGANPLTPVLHARLIDYILSRLDQRLLVSDLAAVAGLSTNRFAEAFTRARGQSPHQFVLQLRLERAVQLLHQSTQSLADIAASCGFASQQHMTQLMRRRLGRTPGRERSAAPQSA